MSPTTTTVRLTTEAFFEALFSGCTDGVVELRVLPTTDTHFSALTNHAVRRGFIAKYVPTDDVYVGVATRKDDSSGALVNCAELPALFTDLDFKTMPETVARAALAAFPLPPTLMVRTGGGIHAYWVLREPFALTNADAGEVAKAWLRRLARALGGDLSAAEPARVLRVPNTFNRKPEYGTPRPVVLELCEPERRYNVSEVMEWCPEIEDAGPGTPFTMPVQKVGKGERNALLFRLARSLKTKGLTPAAILAAALAENQAKCDPPHTKTEVERAVNSALTQPDRPWSGASTNGAPRPPDVDEAEEAEGEAEELESPEVEPATCTFPEAAWRSTFADYRAAMGPISEAPDAAHFATCWALIAARLRRRVWVNYAFPHYPNGYLVVFGPTGDGKTSAMRQGLRFVPSNGSVAVLRNLGSAEALGDWMQASGATGPVAHLLFLEELSTALTRGGWDGSTLLGFLTETFDTPSVYEVPFRKHPVRVNEPTPTLLAGTTPDWFWRSIRETDFHGGFGNRLLFFTGPTKAPVPMPPLPDPALVARVTTGLDALAETPAGAVTLDTAATALWSEFYIAWKTSGRALDPLVAAATKRVPAYALKLALAYAALEHTVPCIHEDQLAAAILVADYGAACADRLISRQRHQTVQGRCETAVLGVLAHADLAAYQVRRAIGGRFSADDTMRAIRALLATGALVIRRRTERGVDIYGLRGRRR